MANIFDNYFNDEEDKKKKDNLPSQDAAQEQKKKVETNVFTDYFKGADYVTPKPVEQPAPPKKEDRSVWSHIQEFGENVVAGAKTIPATIKGALGLLPDTLTSGDDISALKVENRLKTLKMAVADEEAILAGKPIPKDKGVLGILETAIEKSAPSDRVKNGVIQLTPEERIVHQKSLEDTKAQVARLEATVANQEKNPDVFKKMRESSVIETKKIKESNDTYLLNKYGTPDKWSGQWIANEVGSNVPQFLASFGISLATGMITKNPKLALAVGFSTSFVQEAGGAYQDARASGVPDFDAQRIASNTGIANSLIEQIPLGRALGKMDKGGEIKKNVLKRVTAYLTEKVLDGTYEGTTESMQQIVQNAFAKEYKENQSLFEGVPESFVVGGTLGLFGGVSEDVYLRNNRESIIDPAVVDTANKAVEEAIATPKESRTEMQQEMVDSMKDEPATSKKKPVDNIITEKPTQETMPETGVQTIFHGTSGKNIDSILKTGLKTSKDMVDYGEAVYFGGAEKATTYGSDVVVSDVDTSKFKVFDTPTDFIEESAKYKSIGAFTDYLKENFGGAYIKSKDTYAVYDTNLIKNVRSGESVIGDKGVGVVEKQKVTPQKTEAPKKVVAKKITAAETEYETRVNEVLAREKKLADTMSGSQKESRLKGIGMEMSAIKRNIAGEPTYTELRNGRKFMESLYNGKEVTVDGVKATATGKVSFGKHQVKLADGTTKYVTIDRIESTKVTDQQVVDRLKSDAIKKLEGKEQMFSITSKRAQRSEVSTEPTLDEVASQQEQSKNEKALKGDIKTSYSAFDQAYEVFGQIWGELDVAEAGERLFVDGEFVGSKKSSFPDWLPSELRSRKLIDRLMENLNPDNLVYPPDSSPKQQAFIDAVLNEVDSRMGVDSSDIRKASNEGKVAKTVRRSTEGTKTPTGQEVVSKVEKVQKSETLPKENQPVGTGKAEYSRFQERMQEEMLDSDPTRYEFDPETGKYNTLNLEEDAKKAVKFLSDNPEKAIAVGLGLIDPPKGQTVNAIAMAAALKAKEEGNYSLYGELVTSTSLRSTRMGQEIVSLRGQFNLNSSESFIKRVVDARMEKLGKTLVSDAESGGKKLSNKERVIRKIDSEVKKVKAILTSDQAKIKLAQDIIDAMRC